MLWVLGLTLLAVAAVVIWRMLGVAAGRGGEVPGDATDLAAQVIAQGEAFRGDNPENRTPWDGAERLKGVQGNDGVGMG